MSVAVVAETTKEASISTEDQSINTLQQQLQLEPYDGKFLTKQEILLWELYEGISSSNADPSPLSAIKIPSSSSSGKGVSPAHATSTSGVKQSSTPMSLTTPKRQTHASDRERVQNFMAQRQHATGTGAGTNTPAQSTSSSLNSGSSSNTVSHNLSAMERAKQLMAMKSSKPLGRSTCSGTKRINPLADILKGGSGSVVGGSTSVPSSVKRPRTLKPDIHLKPGEIRMNHGRNSIHLPIESFVHQHDWDSTHGSMLKIVLPEVAFATNNTLIIHATIPIRPLRCRFNISTQTSLLEGAPYPGTVLYHFNPRHQRGGQIMQNSNINGRWGCIQTMPRCPITFGESFVLRLTIIPTGFLVFIDEMFQDEFLNRVPIREGENLVLSIPATEEHEGEGRNGPNQDGMIIHHVWWGHAEAPPNLDILRRNLETIRSDRSYDDRSFRNGRGQNSNGNGFQSNPFEVYVGNLPPKTTREELSSLFQYLGCESVRITARGFGFVALHSAQDMNRAVEELDGHEFHGMKLRVSVALGPK